MNVFIKLVCAALMVLSAPAWADLSRDEAAAVAQRVGNGRVLSVDKTQSGNRAAWRVKIVTAKGEVRVIMVDAVTGQAQ